MKRIGLIMSFFILFSFVLTAQPRQQRNPEEMAKRQTEEVKKAVNLNDKQEKQVYDLYLESGKKMSAMREESQQGGFEGIREKMGEIREEQNKKMKSILTDAQWKKYEKFQEERAAARRRGGGGRPGGNR